MPPPFLRDLDLCQLGRQDGRHTGSKCLRSPVAPASKISCKSARSAAAQTGSVLMTESGAHRVTGQRSSADGFAAGCVCGALAMTCLRGGMHALIPRSVV